MASIRENYWETKQRDATRRAFVVQFLDAAGRRRSQSFTLQEHAEEFLAKVRILEDRWRGARRIEKLTGDKRHAVG